MNLAHRLPPLQMDHSLRKSKEVDNDDAIDLNFVLGVLLDHRWLIAASVAMGLALGGAYALFARPVFEANLLIQVEDAKGGAANILGEAASFFDVKTPAAGEIEIIRSRMVIGDAVERTKHYIEAEPKYIPIVGRRLATSSKTLSDPVAVGGLGYVFGSERIVVPHLEASPQFLDTPFELIAGTDGAYSITHQHLDGVVTGTVGEKLNYKDNNASFEILISVMEGRLGAKFEVLRTTRLEAISDLQERLKLAEKGRQSGVIEAKLRDADPERLAVVLNEIGRQYVRQNVERKAAEAQKTLSFLNEQLPQYKRQQEEAENAYNQYRNQQGTVAFDEEAKLVLGQAVDLQTKLLDAKQRRKELSSRFTANHPTLQTLDAQIAAWSQEIESINRRVKRMPQIQQDALRMERDVRVNAEMYQSLLNNALQLSLVKEGKIGNVRLLDEAVVPALPVWPKIPLVIAGACLLGLAAGIGGAFLRNSIAKGIRTPHEIELQTGLNVYSTIPLSKQQAALAARAYAKHPGVSLLAVNDPADPAIESLRSLRTALQFAMLDTSGNRVLITGATPGVGKSFVSANFAAVVAAGGKRVLLIDADLRKGYIHLQLGTKRERGLSELISGSITAEQAIREQITPGLDVITTGVLPPNPAELLLSNAFGSLLDALSPKYDLIVIDTAPVLVAADTAAAAAHADTILLVARADRTYMGELEESAKRLSHAGRSVSGVLFNGMDLTRSRYGAYGAKYGAYRYTTYSYERQGA